MQEIKFSFLMAAYNAKQFILDAIHSALNQTYKNLELIILDDGSTDGTVELVNSVKDDRIRLIKLSHLGSAGRVRAEGYKYITGDYVQILDSDDYISDDLLENYVNVLRNEMVDILVPIPYSDTDGKIESITNTKEYLGRKLDGNTAFELSIYWDIHAWMCVKKELLIDLGFEYEGLRIKTDELNNRKLFFYANSVFISNGCYYYRTNEVSVTRQKANFIKVLESLVDEKLLLDFSIEKASVNAQEKCRNLLIQNLFIYQRKYESYKDEISTADLVKGRDILCDVYGTKELHFGKYNRKNIFGLIFWISSNNYERYSRYVHILNKAYENYKSIKR